MTILPYSVDVQADMNPCWSHSSCSKNINVFENTLTTTVNKFVINEPVNLKNALNN